MSIQSDVNSALGQAGVLAALNPNLQQRAQERREKKQAEVLEKKHAEVQKQADSDKRAYQSTLDGLDAEYEGKTEDEAYYKKREEYISAMNAMDQKYKASTEKRKEAAAKLYDIDPKKYGDIYTEAYLSDKPKLEREQDAEHEAYLSRQREKMEYFGRPPEEYDSARSSQANARAQRLLDTKAQLRADRLLPVGNIGRYGMTVDDFKPDANRYGADRIAGELKRRNNEQK